MIQKISAEKQPTYLLFGLIFLAYGIILFIFQDEGPLVLILNLCIGLYLSHTSGYLLNHRGLEVHKTDIRLKGIAGFRNRIIQKTEIKRIWENEQAYIIDLEKEVVEIERSIFSSTDQFQLSKILTA